MIVEVENLKKTFDSRPPVHVLRGVSFALEKGKSLAIMGKSGEGKSTLLHILGTLEPATSGKLKLLGKELKSRQLSHFRNQHIGFIFQSYNLLEDFTVLDNVLMPLRIGRKNLDHKWGEKLLEEVGLKSKASLIAKFLSGGEKQRVAIARACVMKPSLVLADEPTGNLDEAHSSDIQNLLLNQTKQHKSSLILVTHDPTLASKCDQTLYLKEGQLYTKAL